MSTTCEPTPSWQVVGMCSTWGEKERTCLDSTPRSREGQGKECRSVIVTVDSLEEKRQRAKIMIDLKKTAIKKCHFNRLEGKRKSGRGEGGRGGVQEKWQFF